MNERIEGLWWQARIGYNNQNCDPEVLEKFAELIVRACAAEADRQTIYCRGIPWGRWIKEHFGVEQ